MHLFPCNGCPLAERCAQRAAFYARARAARCTSIRFRCDILGTELRPGRRIVITAPNIEFAPGDYYGEPVAEVTGKIEIPATITERHPGYRFTCTVDPGEHYEADDARRWRKKMPHRRIVRFLDEPDGHVCPQGCVVRDGLCDRGASYWTGEREDQPSYFDQRLCHCGRRRWAEAREKAA